MTNFICADSGNTSSIIIYVVLIVALVAMLIMPYFTQKKKNKEFMSMLDSMKVGDLVKTAGGIIGKITKITDKGDIKTVILETGSKTEKSYMEFDMTMIYCVLKSSKVENKEDDSDKTAEVETKTEETAKVEENVENVAETPVEETKIETAEEEPKKKTTKTAVKKSATKKSSK